MMIWMWPRLYRDIRTTTLRRQAACHVLIIAGLYCFLRADEQLSMQMLNEALVFYRAQYMRPYCVKLMLAVVLFLWYVEASICILLSAARLVLLPARRNKRTPH